MSELIQLVRDSLPEAIGGLTAAAILALAALLFRGLSRQKRQKPQAGKVDTPSTSQVRFRSSPVKADQKRAMLIVDDDIEIIGPVFRPLEREGFELIAATNVSQALDVLQSDQRIDLIVTDIMMPYGDEQRGEALYSGLEVIKAARQLRSDTPIVCLSVVHNKEVGRQLRDLGVNEHLIKPISPNELAQRIKLVLLLSQEPSRQDLILDEISRRKLELRSTHAYARIRALWALGELGHHDPAVLDLLEDVANSDDDPDVKEAATEAIGKIRNSLAQLVAQSGRGAA